MTVTYTAEVATSKFACFLTLLTRWRGSIYKLLWKDFVIFACVYFSLQCLYRFVLSADQKRIFEMISRYCADNNSRIPLAFVLGFFVSLVMSRWWGALTMIPWPDHMAMFVTASVRGLDERGRLMRRTMVRYVCLAYTITMASISPPVRKRFPSLQHFVESGMMTANEMAVLDKMNTPHNKFFIPLAWTTTLVSRARAEGRIKDDFAVKTLNDEINEFRKQLATLFVYDMMTIPLVYTQVVTIAVHTFLLACLMGRQFLTDDPTQLDLYFPVFTFLEYFFYMGWLKVAECLINPFGEDDDDFDINFLIDRNLQVAYLIVDEMHDEHPDLIRDQYWDDVTCGMPYTQASAAYRHKQPFKGSVSDMRVLGSDLVLSTMEAIDERDDDDVDDDDEYDDDEIFHKGSRGGGGRTHIGSSPHSAPLLSKMRSTGSNPVSRLFSRSDSRSQRGGGVQTSPPVPPGVRQGGRNIESVGSRTSRRSDEVQFPMDPVNPDVDQIVARLEEGLDDNYHASSYGEGGASLSKPPSGETGESSSLRGQGSRYGSGTTQYPSGSSGQTKAGSSSPLLLSQPLRLTQSDFIREERREVGTRSSEVPTAVRRTSVLSSTDEEIGGQKSFNSSSDAEFSRQSSNLSTASSASTVREVGVARPQAPPSLTAYKLTDGDDEESEDGGRQTGGRVPTFDRRSRADRRSPPGSSPSKGKYSRMQRSPQTSGVSSPSSGPKSPVWVSAPARSNTASSPSSPREGDRTRLPSVPL